VKYLGVNFDRKLSMTEHIKACTKRGKQKLAVYRAATGVMWGPNPDFALWMFNTFIIPAITYGSIVWGHKLNADHMKKLIQLNRALLTSLAPMRLKTPTAGLEVITGTMPTEYTIKAAALKAYQRNEHHFLRLWWSRISRCAIRPTVNVWRDLALETGSRPVREDIDFFYNWSPPFKYATYNPSFLLADRLLVSLETDGTRGYVQITGGVNTRSRKFESPAGTSPSAFTWYLIVVACELMLRMGANLPKRIHAVHFLLASIPNNLCHSRGRMRSGKDGLTSLRKLSESFSSVTITKYKVRPMANTCDGLVTVLNIRPPKGTFSTRVQKWAMLKWKADWLAGSDCRQTKHWFPEPDMQKVKLLTKLPRLELGAVIQVITGHCWLRRHQSIIDGYGETGCRLCNTEGNEHQTMETPLHLARYCPAVNSPFPTLTMFGSLSKQELLDSSTNWSPSEVVTFIASVQHLGGFQDILSAPRTTDGVDVNDDDDREGHGGTVTVLSETS